MAKTSSIYFSWLAGGILPAMHAKSSDPAIARDEPRLLPASAEVVKLKQYWTNLYSPWAELDAKQDCASMAFTYQTAVPWRRYGAQGAQIIPEAERTCRRGKQRVRA